MCPFQIHTCMSCYEKGWLEQLREKLFEKMLEPKDKETETVHASTALLVAHKHWHHHRFTTLNNPDFILHVAPHKYLNAMNTETHSHY